MFFANLLVVTSLLYICEAGFVDSLPKCSIKDDDCMKGLFQKMLKDGEKGIPELNIPSFDTVSFKDVSINIVDAVNLTITDGEAKGISKCVFKKYSIDIQKHRGNVEAICDVVTAKAHFIVAGDSPIIQSIIGSNEANGNGQFAVKIEKIHAFVDYHIYPQKKNSEIYLKVSDKDIKYNYDVGNAHLKAKNIMIGGTDMSEVISAYFNNDFKQVLKMFGSNFINKFFEIFVSIIQKACDSVPADKFITEDLTPYL